ncbi:MAG: SigB/SigF/SigG family RNA polymerase sigma factor [bacterium]
MTDRIRAAQKGDREAMSALLEENSGLIWSVVRRYYGRGVEPEDLYQLGAIGFLKAVQGFEPAFGTQFSTYAVPKIAGEIRRFLRDDGPVKVSRSIKEKALLLREAERSLTQSLGREPTIGELSEKTGLPREDIALALDAVSQPDSLQRENAETGLTLADTLGGGEGEEQLLERVALREAIASLPERERKVILLRYFRDLTQTRTATLLGISQVQVSRLEKKAMAHLKERLA